ncbi:MAG: M56 family metallopeptidase [Bacteroidota bacterium]|nr:M56 family metallopeptidase [Bacteroidota bacterium]
MSGWSGSSFLQAIGWATLNSFWQMALLWCVVAALTHLFKLSAAKKYQASVGAMLLGFAWFVATFISYYQSNITTFALFENAFTHSNTILQTCLFSASITYLLLLVFPATRLIKNWQFIQVIKKQGLQKANLDYRLFVQNIGAHLGITQKIKLAVSELISSPITIGYLKPVILLPVAILNNLSPTQVEAILLHELSHIRRYDYLLNLIVTIIHTLLYFNPFVKIFMNAIEVEREACCDEMVLQFGYNRVDYASALLHLQKASAKYSFLALGATGKQNLLNRIEKIVGMEKKKTFKLVQIIPLLAALFCVLLFNSVLIIKDTAKRASSDLSYNYSPMIMPWQLNSTNGRKTVIPVTDKAIKQPQYSVASSSQIKIDIFNLPQQQTTVPHSNITSPDVIQLSPVAFNEIDGRLSKEEKENVETAVAATKKVVGAAQWKEIENSIGEVLDRDEKALAKQEYYQELDKVNWENIKQNLKAGYDKIDWPAVNQNVSKAMALVQLDSLQNIYSMALTELLKTEKDLKGKIKTKCSPLPDASVGDIKNAKEMLLKNLDSIKSVHPKKVVRL